MTLLSNDIGYSQEAERLQRLMDSILLQNKLAGLFRAVLIWAFLSGIVLACCTAVEYRFHMESWLRALLLISWLTISSLSFFILFKPVNRGALTPTQFALKMERLHPGLSDSLASAIYFLEHKKSIDGASPEFVVNAVSEAFEKVMDTNVFFRGHVRWVGASFLFSGAVWVLLLVGFFGYLPFSGVALARIVFPYENILWPTLTQIEVTIPRQMVGKNEILRVAARIKGQIPRQATILIKCDEQVHSKLLADINTNENNVSEFVGKVDVSSIGRDFVLQVFAGDAASQPYLIKVLAPPSFLDLDGQPSPVATCLPPFYTGLASPLNPVPGALQMEAPLGSIYQFRGLSDRALKSARLEFQPENKDLVHAIMGTLFASDSVPAALVLLSVSKVVSQDTTIVLDASKTGFGFSFAPYSSGVYSIVIEDENGLYATRSLDLQVRQDPIPLVKFDSILAAGGNLQLLPDAELKIKVTAEDVSYGLKTLGVEARNAINSSGTQVIDLLKNSLLDKNGMRNAQINQLEQDYVFKLRDWRNNEGSPLKSGDRFAFRFFANDHDDVLPLKPWGASDWIEVQVIDRNGLEFLFEKTQEKTRQELIKAREIQRKANKDAAFALNEIKSNEAGIQKALEAVQSAEQGQKNVNERITSGESGISSEIEKIKKLAEANKLKSSASLNRINELGKEIKQIEANALPQAEQQLIEASKRLESADAGKGLEKEKLTAVLENALKKQSEIEKGIDGLLKNLEPWAGLNEMRSEARESLLEMEAFNRKLEETKKRDPGSIGRKTDDLTPDQKEKIEELSSQQNKAAQKAQGLVDKITKSLLENKKLDESVAKNVRKLLDLPNVRDLKENLNQAKQDIESNRLTEASRSQTKAADGVRDIVEKLEENPREMNQRLARKLKDVQRQLEDMKQDMQLLRKKREEARKINDPGLKKEALARNNSDFENLASKMDEMAKTLSRMKNENGGTNLEDSARELRRITQNNKENQGANPDQEPLDNAGEKLQREIQEVRQLAGETEEKLQRERLEKVAESLRQIFERQEALIKESDRFDLLLKEKGAWTRAQILSLGGFSRSQNGLAEEVDIIASRDLAGLPIFIKTIGMAGASMRNASKYSERNSRTQTKGPPLIEKVIPAQKDALRRLEQFQNALKEEIAQLAVAKKDDETPEKQGENPGGNQNEGKPNSAGSGVSDRKPPSIAQLKLLRNLQAELYDRTMRLSTKFPDANNLPEDVRREMLQLQKDQREIGELLEILLEFNRQGIPQGGLQ